MGEKLLLGIDFGTGGCKITIINMKGIVVAYTSEEYEMLHPHQSYSEQNPKDWFVAFVKCIKKVNQLNIIDLKNIVAVALDGSTHNAVLLDHNMEVIRPTIMWTDQRSTEEVKYLENGWGNTIFKITYQKVSPTWTLPQLLWIKNNEPENYSKIHRIMFVKDYIRFLLTNTWQTDFIDAQGTLFFDVKNNKWSDELIQLIDLPKRVLPPICSPTDMVGNITETASQITGLPFGIPVICGTSDVTVEDYAAGAINPGQCIIKLATAGNVNVMTAKPNPNPLTITYSHVVPKLWYTASATNTAAYSMRWFRDTFCFEEIEQAKLSSKNVYQLMDELIQSIPVGSNGLIFHPYLLGERAPYWDANLRASFIGASMLHKKSHFIKAVMEGVAFSLKDCFGLIEKMNIDVSEFIIIGGGAKSDTWSQIICDVFGKKVTRPCVTDASYGSALLAGVGVGVFTDVKEAVLTCLQTDKVFMPNQSNHKKYQKLFKVYINIHDNLKNIYNDIHQIIN
jgi:xylulokinase